VDNVPLGEFTITENICGIDVANLFRYVRSSTLDGKLSDVTIRELTPALAKLLQHEIGDSGS